MNVFKADGLGAGIPAAIRALAGKILSEGYECLLVGGAVRDFFLDAVPNDFDLVTDANLEILLNMFPDARSYGARHRYVVAHMDGYSAEISALWTDGRATCAGAATLLDKILTDTSTRDISINALYYDFRSGNVIDAANGFDDLAERKISFVGDINARALENPLLVFRCVRYAARFNYEYSAPTREILKELSGWFYPTHSVDLLHEVYRMLTATYARVYLDKLLDAGLCERMLCLRTLGLSRQAFDNILTYFHIIGARQKPPPQLVFAVLLCPAEWELNDAWRENCRSRPYLSSVFRKQAIAVPAVATYRTAIVSIWALAWSNEPVNAIDSALKMCAAGFRTYLGFRQEPRT